MSNQKGLAQILLLGFIAALLIAAMSFGYVKYIKNGNENTNSAENETTGWGTYSSAQNNFSFKYPDDFLVGENDLNRANLYREGNSSDQIIVYVVQREPVSTPYYSEIYGEVKPTVALIGGKDGYKYSINTGENLRSENFEVSHNGNTIGIQFNSSTDGNLVDDIQLKNLIISTFQFTDETAVWQTYTNTMYGYQIKYPDSYEVGSGLGQLEISQSDEIHIDMLRISPIDKENTRSISDFLNKKNVQGEVTMIDGRLTAYKTTIDSVQNFNIYTGQDKKYDGMSLNTGTEFYLIDHGQFYYWLSCSVNDSTNPPSEEQYSVCRQIINTFQFTDETAGWQTYTNTKIGYTIKLPSTWSPVSEFDGHALSLQGNTEMVSFQNIESNSPNISLIIQACTKVEPYSCYNQTLQNWKLQSGFLENTDPALAVSGFDAGRTSYGNLNYVRENGQFYIYAYPSNEAENNVQDILSTFQFTD